MQFPKHFTLGNAVPRYAVSRRLNQEPRGFRVRSEWGNDRKKRIPSGPRRLGFRGSRLGSGAIVPAASVACPGATGEGLCTARRLGSRRHDLDPRAAGRAVIRSVRTRLSVADDSTKTAAARLHFVRRAGEARLAVALVREGVKELCGRPSSGGDIGGGRSHRVADFYAARSERARARAPPMIEQRIAWRVERPVIMQLVSFDAFLLRLIGGAYASAVAIDCNSIFICAYKQLKCLFGIARGDNIHERKYTRDTHLPEFTEMPKFIRILKFTYMLKLRFF